jgi:hypothetical protein
LRTDEKSRAAPLFYQQQKSFIISVTADGEITSPFRWTICWLSSKVTQLFYIRNNQRPVHFARVAILVDLCERNKFAQ